MPTHLFERSRGGETALLIQPHAGGPPDEAELEEFAELARSAGATVAAQVTARLDRPNPATLIGSGPETMQRVTMVGSDLALDEGVGTCGKDGQSVPVGVGQPSLLVSQITVGGTKA